MLAGDEAEAERREQAVAREVAFGAGHLLGRAFAISPQAPAPATNELGLKIPVQRFFSGGATGGRECMRRACSIISRLGRACA